MAWELARQLAGEKSKPANKTLSQAKLETAKTQHANRKDRECFKNQVFRVFGWDEKEQFWTMPLVLNTGPDLNRPPLAGFEPMES